jgi:ABC-2 type transport system permease protein
VGHLTGMLNDARYLAFADLKLMLRRRETVLWTFVLPVVFFYFVGTITSNFGGGGASADQLAVLVPSDAGFLADHLIQRLDKGGYEVTRISDDAELTSFPRAMVIPPDFTASVLAGKPVKLAFTRQGGGINGDYDQVRLSKAVYTLLADIIVVGKDGTTPTAGAVAKLSSSPRLLTLDAKPAGKRLQIPSGFEQAVPGTMVFFLLLVLLTNGGTTLVVEREQGILRRLASSPMSRGAVVLGKWGARMLLAMIQIAFCMITGLLLFGVHWGAQVPMVLIVLCAYASLAAAAGILIGTFARTRGQAAALGAISANVLAAIGGCWWPAEIMPRFMQVVARLSPAGLAMDALHQLVNFGAGVTAAVPHVVVLTLAAITAGALAARYFRFH